MNGLNRRKTSLPDLYYEGYLEKRSFRDKVNSTQIMGALSIELLHIYLLNLFYLTSMYLSVYHLVLKKRCWVTGSFI